MAITYTPDALHRLLQTLVAPDWHDRRTADALLFRLFESCGGEAPDPAFATLIDAATERFGEQRDDFLAHLLAFRCNAAALAPWMREDRPWQPLDAGTEFPLRDTPRIDASDMYGSGIHWYLCSQAEKLQPLVPQLTLSLRHSASSVRDTARIVLGRIARVGHAAFEEALQIAFERGPVHGPGRPMHALARIADADPARMQRLIESIDVRTRDRRIEVICSVAGELRTVPPELFAALLSALRHTDAPEHRCVLLGALTAASVRCRLRDVDTLLDVARRYARSAVTLERAASAWPLARLSTQAAEGPRLLALLGDVEWTVRSCAAAAVQQWTSPGPDLVHAVACLIGDVVEDGYPHDNAIAALTAWGVDAAAAMSQIERWLRLDEIDTADVLALPDLLDALGEHGKPLTAAVRVVVQTCFPHADADVEDAERFEHETGYVHIIARPTWAPEHDVEALARRLGFDPDENIPGSRATASLVAQPDTETRLRAWLQT